MPLAISAKAEAEEPGSAKIANEVIYLIHGESDYFAGTETERQMYFLKIVTMELPLNEPRIYLNVPKGASGLKVWTYSGNINSTNYGYETAGDDESLFFINVPPPSERIYSINTTLDNESELLADHSLMINVTYSSGNIHLTQNSTSGIYVSPIIDFAGADVGRIDSAILRLAGEHLEKVSSEISIDNGTTWHSIIPESVLNFTEFAKSLRIRLIFEGNPSQEFDPKISSMTIVSNVVPSLFTVHISYLVNLQFENGKVHLDLSEPMEFTQDGTLLLLIFLMDGYTPSAAGINLVTGTSSMFEDKIFFHNSTRIEGRMTVSLEIVSPPPDLSSLYLLAAIVILTTLVVLFVRRSKRKDNAVHAYEKASPRNDSEESDASSSIRRAMINRKKELLKESEELRSKLRKGEIKKDEFESRSSNIKKELKEIKKELSKLARELSVDSSAPSIGVDGPVEPDYESMLELLAKLDADHEAGRLPDEAYSRLRKTYVEKAARLRASLGFQENKLIEQKRKLIEALSSLDEEFERGEVERKVYDNLRSSYKEELVAIMRKIDSIKDEGGEEE